MKHIFFSILLTTFLHAGEIDRIENIVNNIEKLREDYTQCMRTSKNLEGNSQASQKDLTSAIKEELKERNKQIAKYKNLLHEENFKNVLLEDEIEELKKKLIRTNMPSKKETKANEKYTKLLVKKENENKELGSKYNKIIETKENKIKNLKKKVNSLKSGKETIQEQEPRKDVSMKKLTMQPFVPQVTKREVTMLKKEKTKAKVISKVSKAKKEKIVNIKPSTFHLNKNASIYDAVDGKVVYQWNVKTPFTSSITTENWIKITGDFVNDKWHQVEQSLWIKKVDAKKKIKRK